MARLVSAVVCVSLLVAVRLASAESFILNCTLPFETMPKHRTIEDTCAAHGDAPLTGGSANDSAHALQNLAKNNFCATATPELVTFISFKRLQQKLDKKVSEAKAWNQFHLPADRNVLIGIYTTSENATIGEGAIVKFAAWLMKLRKGGQESCNCGDANGTARERGQDRPPRPGDRDYDSKEQAELRARCEIVIGVLKSPTKTLRASRLARRRMRKRCGPEQIATALRCPRGGFPESSVNTGQASEYWKNDQ
jgi:hypothetical protein